MSSQAVLDEFTERNPQIRTPLRMKLNLSTGFGADLRAAADALQKALDASREMVPAKNGAYGTMMAMNMSTAALPQQYLSLLESLISSLR